MDTFICDHFFNKPLDVALVVDPASSNGPFSSGRPRVTGGPAPRAASTSQARVSVCQNSRFYAAQLEGKLPMPNDPRYSGLPGVYPPTVVQVGESKQTWLAVAVLGLLTMQFLVLALIAWRILMPDGAAAAARPATNGRGRELAAQRAVLDRVIGKLDVAPDGIVQDLEQERQKNEELQSSNLGLLAQVREMTRTQQQIEDQLAVPVARERETAGDRGSAQGRTARRPAGKWTT